MPPRRRVSRQRRWDRLPLAVPMFVRGENDRGKQFLEFTTALNISAGGALLAVRRHIHPGSKLSIEIPAGPLPYPDKNTKSIRNLRARTVRVDHSERCYLVGVQFASPLR